MNIVNMIHSIRANPKLLKELENTILEIAKTDDYSTLRYLLETNNLECQFYVAIILEIRLKLITKNKHRIELFVPFFNYILSEYVINTKPNMFVSKIGDVYALMGIYFYPFFVNLYETFNLPNIGYLFYKKFLFACNTNAEITNDRRIELRNITKDKNIQMLSCLQCDRLDAIEICNYALLCVKENINLLQAVLQIGGEDDETLNFFETYLNLRNSDHVEQIVEFIKRQSLEFLDRMIEIFVCVRKELYCNINLVSYVCQSFDGSMLHLDYLTMVMKAVKSNPAYEGIALEIMKLIIRISESDKQKRVLELITIINGHYNKVGVYVLENYGTNMDVKMVLILLKTHPKKENLRFTNVLVECYRLFYLESRDCVELIDNLSLNDSESCGLITKLIRKFNLDRDRIFNIMTKCKYCESLPSDDLFISCIIELEKYNLQEREALVTEFLSGDFTLRKRLRLLAVLKKDYKLAEPFLPSYLEYFMTTNDVETGFAILGVILKKTNFLSQQIYAHIFSNLQKFTLQQLSIFITDLFNNMDDKTNILFFDAIYQKLTIDFETANYIDITFCIKAFGNFLEKKIIAQKNNTFIDGDTTSSNVYYNMLVNLLNLRDNQAIRKVYEVIKNNKLNANFDLNYLADIYNTNPDSEILSLIVYVLENSENTIKQSFKGGLKNRKDIIRQYLKQKSKTKFLVDKYNVCNETSVDVSKFFD